MLSNLAWGRGYKQFSAPSAPSQGKAPLQMKGFSRLLVPRPTVLLCYDLG
jgi:hypothetical protein